MNSLELFGPAPILKSESPQAYHDIMRRLLAEFTLPNIVERMFVKELTDSSLADGALHPS